MVAKKSLSDCIKNFTPAWFTVIMGTGAVSSLIHHFAYGNADVIWAFTLIVFFLNFILFILISAATIARYVMFPEVWSKMMRHPAQSLFLGAIPMGFATLLNICHDIYVRSGFGGPNFIYFIWALWWIDALGSFFCAMGMIYAMSNMQSQPFANMAAVWLLPVVTLIVASSTGGLLASAIQPFLALMMITVYLARLIVHGPPDVNLILSSVIVLGPLGQGGYSLLLNGANLASLFPLENTGQFPMNGMSGDLMYSFCFCVAYALFVMGIAWACIAIFSIFAVVRKSGPPKFAVPYWGLIFPNAVYSLLAVQMGVILDGGFFRVFGAMWTTFTFVLWAAMTIRSIPAILDRSIFVAPCLATPPPKRPPSSTQSLDEEKASGGNGNVLVIEAPGHKEFEVVLPFYNKK
ncbi:voltage-dependent anion channel [Boletus edulis BED1]|uniref:Voltage-dependent anion channel n=1 Tax=Boletus edulis BED1 TaxID=1328754 RepID=A0AAD4GFQ0_BOLED|nr:voltage-dependent anion channel [Boletus edulis BED1]